MWTETTRPKYEREHLRYATDVTDAEWAVIVQLSSVQPPAQPTGGGQHPVPRRRRERAQPQSGRRAHRPRLWAGAGQVGRSAL